MRLGGSAAIPALMGSLVVALACLIVASCAVDGDDSGSLNRGPGSPEGEGAISSAVEPGVDAEAGEAKDEQNPLGANGACYVCHMLFVREEISKTHLAAGVPCVHCHGVSAGHANDEDIGATPPDRSYKRQDVNGFCRKCHEAHDVAPEKIVAQWISKVRPEASPNCTDCHGAHRIAAAATE